MQPERIHPYEQTKRVVSNLVLNTKSSKDTLSPNATGREERIPELHSAQSEDLLHGLKQVEHSNAQREAYENRCIEDDIQNVKDRKKLF